ncbi:MAG: ATP-binding cassette domain-containing protein, partial [Anaerolineae bacterium]|nr:ATP-binding cassette domain-containing protein [Anaerolineae bacterium]
IGPNGAGKTTFLKMITGEEAPDRGTVRVGDTVQLAYADQFRALDGAKSVWEEISGGLDTLTLGTRQVNSRAYVASFNFTGSDQQKAVQALSGGERNRVHLAKTLKAGGNVIMLDEPTNDLDVNTLRALEDALVAFAGCVIVVSHDRWFLDRVATHILAFEEEGRVHYFLGNWSDYEADQRERFGKNASTRGKYRALRRG